MVSVTQDLRSYAELLAKEARKASFQLRYLPTEKKNRVLHTLAALLKSHRLEIKEANAQDLHQARENQLKESLIERLILNDKAIDLLIRAVEDIIALPDPVGEVIEGKRLPNGLELRKVRIPLGVIAVIYESRPNVTVDVAALCLKSGNAVILRGGKEAYHSNKILAELFQKALWQEQLSEHAVQFVETVEREFIGELVQLRQYIDLVVPRGGEALIRYVTENSLVPVVKHDKGVCHVYVHPSANYHQAETIVLNAKTQRPGVCNAAECLILHRDWPYAAQLLGALHQSGVLLRGDEATRQWVSSLSPTLLCYELTEEGYSREYLALEMSVKVVDRLEEAISHILQYGSQHSEAIIAREIEAIRHFCEALDSAAIFINCSTRFHDGGEFGLGAEVGIATGKLHVRGPMGLRDLTTFQYIVWGDGHIRK
ncbi:MAG: glutamate-5-semialdehyde dehydrogenase [Leptospiraceae bacterium]|nr:glutamate-5-semialdehyde dehydrogenase [Leptospiraceae bacterium]MDW8305888.1 glutamate-5-semialdehyde dehydrogenase [Leptospiraceae bacterium]